MRKSILGGKTPSQPPYLGEIFVAPAHTVGSFPPPINMERASFLLTFGNKSRMAALAEETIFPQQLDRWAAPSESEGVKPANDFAVTTTIPTMVAATGLHLAGNPAHASQAKGPNGLPRCGRAFARSLFDCHFDWLLVCP